MKQFKTEALEQELQESCRALDSLAGTIYNLSYWCMGLGVLSGIVILLIGLFVQVWALVPLAVVGAFTSIMAGYIIQAISHVITVFLAIERRLRVVEKAALPQESATA